ncbi:MAG: hypothetical protein P9M04_01280, partial [Candidatus Orphnella occulta]|nr:hypothetical protein [Candidatus Orphnella occulta]
MTNDRHLFLKSIALVSAVIIVGIIGTRLRLSVDQIIALCAFSLSILGTLLFWQFRLSFAFLGATIILFTGVA